MRNTLTICLLLFGIQVYSQKDIKLIDAKTGIAIKYAHFIYQNQTGTSSTDGVITINYIPKEDLLLSHINYGKKRISAIQLEKAFRSGFISLKQFYISLTPTTVIALSGKTESQIMEVNNSDRLSHDAGEFLGQSSIIGGIRKSGSYGFDPVLRGFKYDQLTIIMDNGLSATAACPNRMDPPASQIPLTLVDRVEIHKGPHSLRFGSSFGGSIHFKSAPAQFPEAAKFIGHASGNYESNGNIYRSEVFAGSEGRFYNYGIYGAYSKGDDYITGNGEKIPSGFNRRNLGLSGIFKLSEKQIIKLSANNNFSEDVDFPALNMDLREDDTWLLNFIYRIKFSNSRLSSLSTSCFGSFVDHNMDNLSKKLASRKVNAITLAKTKNYGARTEAAFQFKNSSLFAGMDYKTEEAKGNRSREMLTGSMAGKTLWDKIWQDSKISRLGLFGEYHFSMNELFFVTSARMEHNSAESKDKAPEFIAVNQEKPSNKINFSTSLGVNHNVSEQVRMGIWFGRAERSGSLTERFINFLPVDIDPYERIGNTMLKSEVNFQLDYNFTWKTEKYELGVTLFTSELRNYISSKIRPDLSPKVPSSAGVKQYYNIDKAAMRGFEFFWFQKLSPLVFQKLTIAYTYGKNKDANTALPEIPPLDSRYSLGGTFFKKKFLPELSVRHALKQNRVASNFGETTTPSFTTVDFKSSWQLSQHFTFAGGIRNVFDEVYYEHLNRSVKGSGLPIHAPGRSFYITLSVNLL